MTAVVELDAGARLLDLAGAFMASRVILSAFELEVFEQFGDGRVSGSHIAAALGTDARATETLLDALAALGILERHDDGFEVREQMTPFVKPTGSDYAGDLLRHLCRLWDRWSDLTQAVKVGRARPDPAVDTARQTLARAMRRYARDAATRLAGLLDGSHVDSILDVGGGSGAFSIALARRFPGARVELCERDDHALRLARTDIGTAGLSERIRVREADALTDDVGSGYDLALVSSVLCTCTDDECRRLLRTVTRALNRGGRLVIRDFMLGSTLTSPPPAALFSVSMLVTGGGRVRSRRELRGWLEELGYRAVHWLPMDPMTVMIGEKAPA